MPFWVHIAIFIFLICKLKTLINKPNFKNKVVLVTGGSSGIGESLALEFVKLGAKVIISGRNLKELNRVKNSAGSLQSQIEILELDLSFADDAYKKACNFIADRKIDILVNNAGIGQRCGFLENLDNLNIERSLMEVNYFSPVALTKAVYKSMNPGGQIVIISSMGGVIGSPYRTAYSGSKFAVAKFFETLSAEGSQCDISIIYPSYVKSNFSKNALDSKGESFGKDVENTKNGMAADVFARKAVEGIYKRETYIFVCEFKQKVIYFLKYWIPSLSDWILYKYGLKVKREMESA
ncbi:hypothetical protein SteCoe_3706 [Stentor coeruleus]|uniref:Uncharacterized protein n=1 Tax=Stentor coeruleus TaxID=5963 RepID=A0A1R2CWL2_9CILI|nr:hypothetical protein SteCoe_3706 [Stentor coeruleus]